MEGRWRDGGGTVEGCSQARVSQARASHSGGVAPIFIRNRNQGGVLECRSPLIPAGRHEGHNCAQAGGERRTGYGPLQMPKQCRSCRSGNRHGSRTWQQPAFPHAKSDLMDGSFSAQPKLDVTSWVEVLNAAG